MSTRQRKERTAGWVYVPDEYRERSFTAAELAEVDLRAVVVGPGRLLWPRHRAVIVDSRY